MKKLLIVAFLSSLLFVACSKSDTGVGRDPGVASRRPTPAALDGLNAKQAMALANRWYVQKQTSVTTNVTPDSVNFEFPNGRTRKVKMPKDQMVVAIAPYVQTTHPCSTHYMSGCQGELVGEQIQVLAVDGQGRVLVDDTIETMYNGFIELWLPREQVVKVSLSYQGKAAEGMIPTYNNSSTCVTTMQLM